MKHRKYLFVILFILTFIICIPKTTNAYMTGIGRFEKLWVGVPEYDVEYGHGPCLYYYTIDGDYAHCIQLPVRLKKMDYASGPYDDPRIGYALAADHGYKWSEEADFQIKQAVIWALLGQVNIEGLYAGDWGAVQAAKNLYYAAVNYTGNVGAPGLSTTSLEFNPVGSDMVSQPISANLAENNSYYDISLAGFPAGTYITDMNGNRMQTNGINWNSTFQIRIPLESIMTDITSVASSVISHGTTYNVSATYYSTSIESQQLISSHPTYTDKSASTPMGLARSIRAFGTLNVVKKDEWDKGVKGATFKISLGSNVFSAVTNEEGIANFSDVPAGTYTVEETYAPEGYYNDRENISARVITATTTTATKLDRDEKAKVTFYKKDRETDIPQGDAKLSGAQYKIYAREDIYAQNGIDLLYSNGQEVATCTTGDDGVSNTVIIPLGKYMYKEVVASEGYNLNDEEVEFTVSYDNQDVEFVEKNITVYENVKRNNIEIIKKLQRTDSTPQLNLAGAKFSATLKSDRSKVYYSELTDETGYTTITNLPYGTYEVEEVVVPDTALKIDLFDVFVELDKTEAPAYRYTKENVAKKMQITIYKEDIETGIITQGDAHLENSEYTIYRDEACTDAVETVTIALQSDGRYTATTGNYLVGTYYIKETKRPEGYLIDENVYTITQIPSEQTVEYSYHDMTSRELVEKGNVYIVKYLENNTNFEQGSTTKNPAVGVELTLTLDSKPETNYTAVIDEKGYAEFIDIPYGWYTITETKSIEYVDIMDPQPLYIARDKQKLYYIVQDPRNKRNLKIVKRDEETGEVIPLAGSTFKVWDVSEARYLKQTYNYPTPVEIDEFVTTTDGTLVLPDGVIPGAYELEEINAPYGYARKDTRVPFTIEATSPENPEQIKTITVDFTNVAQKARVVVFKKGEMLSDKMMEGDITRPVYELRGLEGVEYAITAREDIVTPDGTVRMRQGESVTIVTGPDGIATSEPLYLGSYSIKEVKTKTGYLASATEFPFVLEYRGQEITIWDKDLDFTDVRQKMNLNLFKNIQEPKYIGMLKNAYKDVVLGVYTKEALVDNMGNVVIDSDVLVDKLYINEDGTITQNYDLPMGDYYIKEIATNENYVLNEKNYYFTFLPEDNVTPVIDIKLAEDVTNELKNLKTLRLVKYANRDIGPLLRVRAFFTGENLDDKHTLNNAKFKLYWDDNGVAQPLVTTDGIDTYTSDENGLILVDSLPYGKYYYQEVDVPKGYELDDALYEFEIDKNGEEQELEVYNSIVDIKVFTKTDAFDSEVIPDCTFEILDEDENVIYTNTTDENGDFYMPIDMLETGKIYYYHEIEAPDIYELNDELHEFVLNEDETVTIDEVSNLRKTSTILISKTDFLNGDKIPNCTFVLESKETDYRVEGTTDENGEYYFENVPYGEYTYTEISAPEEYNIDTTPHDITINGETYEIRVRDEKIVNTGDIKFPLVLSVGIISVFGLVYIIYRYKDVFFKNKK
ncbi:MAG: hypothetical protein IKD74_01485 [Clostridia bacterium]|nr:hypothetical protein [Clostridia bacterium]